jgi:16S rRNA (uracil1498-N3)-methyltransferase
VLDRFFCPDPPKAGRAWLTGDEARHLTRVRRLGIGDQVELFDGRGLGWQAEVVELGKDRVEFQVGPPVPDRRAACEVTLATAVPKGERFDWLVEKATELGVARLIPLLTERSIVVPRTAKLERLRRLVVEASKQCGRNRLMEVADPCPLGALWDWINASFRLVAHPGGRPLLSKGMGIGPGGTVCLAIGPEGGFADVEIRQAEDTGWVVADLGATRLRIETAGLTASAVVLALARGETHV